MAFKDFTKTQQQTIRYLERVENAKKQADRNIDELAELKRVKDGLRASFSDGAVSQNENAPYVAVCEKIEAMRKTALRENDGYLEVRERVTKLIKSLKNPTYSLLLQKRYLDFKLMEEIADEMHYSERRIYELHKKALDAFYKTMRE